MSRQHSAGGVVSRGEEIVLISPRSERWQLPKGHLEEGETARQAALREVREETGVSAEILRELPEIAYWFRDHQGRRIHKRVTYYLMRYLEGSIVDFDPREVVAAGWFPWEVAIEKLTFDNDRQVVQRALELVRDPDRPEV